MKSPVSDPTKELNTEIPELEDVKEDRIREIIRYLICKNNDDRPADFLSENDLTYEIIKLIKCDIRPAHAIIKKMEDLGLGICQSFTSYLYVKGTRTYEIIRFAEMRGYLTKDEREDFYKRRSKYYKMIEEREKEYYRKKGLIFD